MTTPENKMYTVELAILLTLDRRMNWALKGKANSAFSKIYTRRDLD